jgi:hypothetical protein
MIQHVAKTFMFDLRVIAMEDEQARLIALRSGKLRDQFWRQMKIKVRGAHRRGEVSGKIFLNHEIFNANIFGTRITRKKITRKSSRTELRNPVCLLSRPSATLSPDEFGGDGRGEKSFRILESRLPSCNPASGLQLLLIVLSCLVSPLVVVVV